MALLEDFNLLKAENESLKNQLATAGGHSKQVADLTEANRVFQAQCESDKDIISKLTGELTICKESRVKDAECAAALIKSEVAAKDSEWQARAATEAAKIVAAAGGQPVETKGAEKPAGQEKKNLTGRDRFTAAFAEANPNLVPK